MPTSFPDTGRIYSEVPSPLYDTLQRQRCATLRWQLEQLQEDQRQAAFTTSGTVGLGRMLEADELRVLGLPPGASQGPMPARPTSNNLGSLRRAKTRKSYHSSWYFPPESAARGSQPSARMFDVQAFDAHWLNQDPVTREGRSFGRGQLLSPISPEKNTAPVSTRHAPRRSASGSVSGPAQSFRALGGGGPFETRRFLEPFLHRPEDHHARFATRASDLFDCSSRTHFAAVPTPPIYYSNPIDSRGFGFRASGESTGVSLCRTHEAEGMPQDQFGERGYDLQRPELAQGDFPTRFVFNPRAYNPGDRLPNDILAWARPGR